MCCWHPDYKLSISASAPDLPQEPCGCAREEHMGQRPKMAMTVSRFSQPPVLERGPSVMPGSCLASVSTCETEVVTLHRGVSGLWGFTGRP